MKSKQGVNSGLNWETVRDGAEYERFVSGHQNGSFMQSLGWPLVKSNWKHEALVCRGPDGEIKGSLSMLIMPMGAGAMLYAPRGPVCDYTDKETLAALLAGAEATGKKFHAHVLKMDPYVLKDSEEAPVYTENFKALGCELQENAGFKDTIQPRHNFMLTGLRGKTEEQLLMSFDSDTRYYVRRAAKMGVQCRTGAEGLDDFYALYEDTGKRQGFAVRPREYFTRFLNAFPDKARLYMCYFEETPLCGGLAIQYGHTTSHVYGASGTEMRKLNATYLLQWEMMKWALAGGCNTYDMQGIATTPEDSEALYTVYQFKKNFPGQVVTTVGEFTRIYRPAYHQLMEGALKVKNAIGHRGKPHNQ